MVEFKENDSILGFLRRLNEKTENESGQNSSSSSFQTSEKYKQVRIQNNRHGRVQNQQGRGQNRVMQNQRVVHPNPNRDNPNPNTEINLNYNYIENNPIDERDIKRVKQAYPHNRVNDDLQRYNNNQDIQTKESQVMNNFGKNILDASSSVKTTRPKTGQTSDVCASTTISPKTCQISDFSSAKTTTRLCTVPVSDLSSEDEDEADDLKALERYQNSSEGEISSMLRKQNSKLITLTTSITALTKERQKVMKKISAFERMIENKTQPKQAHNNSTIVQNDSLAPEAGSKPGGTVIPFNPNFRNWAICASNDRQVIDRSETILLGKLDRKARSLVLYPEDFKSATSRMEELAIVPTVNGMIQIFNIKKKIELEALPQDAIHATDKGWSEEISWVSRDTVALSLHQNHSLTLLRNCRINHREQFEFEIVNLRRSPHSKIISAIEAFDLGDSQGGVQFFTGSADRSIQYWKTANIYETVRSPSFETKSLPSIHTSEITCLHFDKFKNTLYSGGKDSRFAARSLETEEMLYGGKDIRWDGIISDILPVMNSPKTLIIGEFHNKPTNFYLFDARTNSKILTIPRGLVSGLYFRASIHPNGMLLTDGDPLGGIRIWDLRYINVESGPQVLNGVHNKKIIAATFSHGRDESSSLLSVGLDNELKMTKYFH